MPNHIQLPYWSESYKCLKSPADFGELRVFYQSRKISTLEIWWPWESKDPQREAAHSWVQYNRQNYSPKVIVSPRTVQACSCPPSGYADAKLLLQPSHIHPFARHSASDSSNVFCTNLCKRRQKSAYPQSVAGIVLAAIDHLAASQSFRNPFEYGSSWSRHRGWRTTLIGTGTHRPIGNVTTQICSTISTVRRTVTMVFYETARSIPKADSQQEWLDLPLQRWRCMLTINTVVMT